MNSARNPSHDELSVALEDADLRVLLMCLFHLTGDSKWLEHPYQPIRDVKLIADRDAGFSPALQREIRDSAYKLLRPGAPSPVIVRPTHDLLHRMMNTCLGENVDAAYVPLMAEDSGLSPDDARWRTRPSEADLRRTSVLIVGAGVSGIAIAIKLRQLGVAFRVVEKNPSVGGTWYENRYPGCGVDTPNHFYCYSFAPNHGWSHYFSPATEIEAYLEACVDNFGIRTSISLNTRLTGAEWDDASSVWRARLVGPDGPEVAEASILVTAIGQFNEPAVPSIAGIDDFGGIKFHSAQWPDDVDLSDKDVAVIGTGASAMQFVPNIVDLVSSLTIYQRSPQWCRPIPAYKEHVKPGTQWLLENVPFYAAWNRFTLFWRYGDHLLRFLRKDPDWPFPDRSLNRVNDRHRQELIDYIHSELGDRVDLLPACLPDYPPYGKRMLIDNGWYGALQKPGVCLVVDGIDKVLKDGIVTENGEFRPADVIVLATGFKVTDLSARLGIIGRDEKSLADAWANDNPTAYLGMTVPGFPNMFIMYGPNTNLAHGGSMFFHAECQARYISKMVVELVEHGLASMECTKDAHDLYVQKVDDEHSQLVWTHPGMSTYYRNASGRVVSVSPWRVVDYWEMTHEPQLTDYLLRGDSAC
jgi:4-hydroxyacetophenone monooxygenase